MAFVFDQNDPSGLGMFSKPGRFTGEKYMVFQKKDEILSNERKVLRVNALSSLQFDMDKKKPRDPNEEEEIIKKSTSVTPRIRPVISIFEKTVSREKLHKLEKNKSAVPPVGFYNPKYKQIEKKPLILFDYNLEKPREFENPGLWTSRSIASTDSLPPAIADIDKRKIYGPIDFSKQTPREYYASHHPGPHDERFTVIKIPENWSSNRRLPKIELDKYAGRDKYKMWKDLEFAPDYNPNVDFIKKPIAKPGPKFESQTPRAPLHNPSQSLSDKYYDLPIENKHLRIPKFEKFLNRETDPKSPFPSFMQKSLHSRLSIEQVSQKTLEINNYSDAKMVLPLSSFRTATQTQNSVDGYQNSSRRYS